VTSRLLVIAALIELIAPVAAAAVLLFGGATIGNCHLPVGDGLSLRPACPVEVVVWPPLRTADGIAISLAICALAWLAANYVLVSHLAIDRPRLLRLAVGIGVAGLAMANFGFAHGLRFRLLYAAEGAVTWGLAGLGLAWILAIAWSGLRPGATEKRVLA
jgi:hypothetical protein